MFDDTLTETHGQTHNKIKTPTQVQRTNSLSHSLFPLSLSLIPASKREEIEYVEQTSRKQVQAQQRTLSQSAC